VQVELDTAQHMQKVQLMQAEAHHDWFEKLCVRDLIGDCVRRLP
jgi:hypothetical protein